MARSLVCTNPDLDEDFVEFYKDTCELISSLLGTKNETLILDGEGILGLEAACASLTEPGDKVLIIENGVYGEGFADFVSMYGGVPEFYHADRLNAIDPDALSSYLKEHHDYKYATVVHCDTPSGMLNPVEKICPLLKEYGILTVVDSVSGMFGNHMDVDKFQIDLLCGGSQKAVSAPPGLTFVTISDAVKMPCTYARRRSVLSMQAFWLLRDIMRKKWFPYTMPISDIYGLRAAFDNIASDPELEERTHRIAEAARRALTEAGLKLHLESGFSDTVTVFDIPAETTCDAILSRMKKEHNIMLAGSFDDLSGKVIRIGHMGNNANFEDMAATMYALSETLTFLGVNLKRRSYGIILKILSLVPETGTKNRPDMICTPFTGCPVKGVHISYSINACFYNSDPDRIWSPCALQWLHRSGKYRSHQFQDVL